MRILVVDDEKVLVKGVKWNLENDGYVVDGAYDGAEALSLFLTNKYDLVLLDLMLPKIDGLDVCRKIRETSNVPVIMVTAKTEGKDKLIGFEYGADDYVTKPYDILELKARIRVILKRAQQSANESGMVLFECAGLSINFVTRAVIANQNSAELTAKEFDVLATLVRSPGKVYSREELLRTVWNDDFSGDSRTVDVHIRKIREKIEIDDANPQYILTKWGVGYFFKAQK